MFPSPSRQLVCSCPRYKTRCKLQKHTNATVFSVLTVCYTSTFKHSYFSNIIGNDNYTFTIYKLQYSVKQVMISFDTAKIRQIIASMCRIWEWNRPFKIKISAIFKNTRILMPVNPVQGFLTDRNTEITNVWCFKLLNSWWYCYTAVDTIIG